MGVSSRLIKWSHQIDVWCVDAPFFCEFPSILSRNLCCRFFGTFLPSLPRHHVLVGAPLETHDIPHRPKTEIKGWIPCSTICVDERVVPLMSFAPSVFRSVLIADNWRIHAATEHFVDSKIWIDDAAKWPQLPATHSLNLFASINRPEPLHAAWIDFTLMVQPAIRLLQYQLSCQLKSRANRVSQFDNRTIPLNTTFAILPELIWKYKVRFHVKKWAIAKMKKIIKWVHTLTNIYRSSASHSFWSCRFKLMLCAPCFRCCKSQSIARFSWMPCQVML